MYLVVMVPGSVKGENAKLTQSGTGVEKCIFNFECVKMHVVGTWALYLHRVLRGPWYYKNKNIFDIMKSKYL